jgi:hypothetical protein
MHGSVVGRRNADSYAPHRLSPRLGNRFERLSLPSAGRLSNLRPALVEGKQLITQ